MKKNVIKLTSLVLSAGMFFTACQKEKTKPAGEFSGADFIVCEGNFNSNDGEIFAIASDGLHDEIFSATNDRPLGDVVNSMKIIGDKAYIVVNNSQKIEVVNASTFQSEGAIKGLSYPRYVEKRNDNEIFVSNGNGFGGDYVYVVNTLSLEKTDSVATGAGPNAMVAANGKLFVANCGGWSNDKTITVIDIPTLAVEKTITVGDKPTDLEIDENGDILAFCKGLSDYKYDENGNYLGEEVVSNSSVVKISATNYSTTTIKEFDHQIQCYGENVFACNGGTIFYLDGGVRTMNENGSGDSELLSDFNVYGISFDKKDNGFWLFTTPYGSSHEAALYKTDGTRVVSYKVGNYPKMALSAK